MKLYHHKTLLYSHWFDIEGGEIPDNDWIEKCPPYADYVFNEELQEWVKPEIKAEYHQDC